LLFTALSPADFPDRRRPQSNDPWMTTPRPKVLLGGREQGKTGNSTAFVRQQEPVDVSGRRPRPSTGGGLSRRRIFCPGWLGWHGQPERPSRDDRDVSRDANGAFGWGTATIAAVTIQGTAGPKHHRVPVPLGLQQTAAEVEGARFRAVDLNFTDNLRQHHRRLRRTTFAADHPGANVPTPVLLGSAVSTGLRASPPSFVVYMETRGFTATSFRQNPRRQASVPQTVSAAFGARR